MSHAILLISCPDQKGITARVADFIFKNNGNILHADQHIDEQSNTFFMRIEWELKNFKLTKEELQSHFQEIASKFAMTWDVILPTRSCARRFSFLSHCIACMTCCFVGKRDRLTARSVVWSVTI